jgi:hypothetical protein
MSSVPGTITVNYYFYGERDWFTVIKRGPPTPQSELGTVLFNQKIKKRGTLTFDHDPSTGRDYVFQVLEDSKKWEYTLYYPIDDVSYVEPTPPNTDITMNWFSGSLVSIVPGYNSAAELGQNFGSLNYYSAGVNQTIKLAGLKPNTLHRITMSDTTNGAQVYPTLTSASGIPATVNNELVSDASGGLEFNLVVNTQVLVGVTGLSYMPETVQVLVASADYMSIAGFQLQSKTALTTNYYGYPIASVSPQPIYTGGRVYSENNIQEP